MAGFASQLEAVLDRDAIERLQKNIARFRGRVRRAMSKLSFNFEPADPKVQASVKKALDDAKVVEEALKRGHELISGWARGKTDPKIAERLAAMKKLERRWHDFLADPKAFREKATVGYGVARGSPGDILTALWSESSEPADAIRQAANAVFYAKR